MNKLCKCFIFIIIALMPLVILTSCTHIEAEEPITAEEKLDILLANLQNNVQQINGSMHYNDTKQESYDAIISKSALKMSAKINTTDYYYSSKVLLKTVNDRFTVENPNTTLAEQKDLMPFNLMYFTYSDGNSDSIYMTDSTINISFINKGAMFSFECGRAVVNGVLSIYFENEKIVSSVFTALQESKKITTYYKYNEIVYTFAEAPEVAPTDTLNYAIYAISQFSKKYADMTLHTKDNHNTEAKISSIILDESKVKSVTSVDITDQNKYYTLTINYNSKEMIVGVGSAITTLTIAYNSDYEINNVKINTTDYVLK